MASPVSERCPAARAGQNVFILPISESMPKRRRSIRIRKNTKPIKEREIHNDQMEQRL